MNLRRPDKCSSWILYLFYNTINIYFLWETACEQRLSAKCLGPISLHMSFSKMFKDWSKHTLYTAGLHISLNDGLFLCKGCKKTNMENKGNIQTWNAFLTARCHKLIISSGPRDASVYLETEHRCKTLKLFQPADDMSTVLSQNQGGREQNYLKVKQTTLFFSRHNICLRFLLSD